MPNETTTTRADDGDARLAEAHDCPNCAGTGKWDAEQTMMCSWCAGAGKLTYERIRQLADREGRIVLEDVVVGLWRRFQNQSKTIAHYMPKAEELEKELRAERAARAAAKETVRHRESELLRCRTAENHAAATLDTIRAELRLPAGCPTVDVLNAVIGVKGERDQLAQWVIADHESADKHSRELSNDTVDLARRIIAAAENAPKEAP